MRALLRMIGCLSVLAAAPLAGAQAGDTATACLRSIARAETASPGLPKGLLAAIAQVESGRSVPGTSVAVPWPWTINSPAGAFYLASRAEAVAKVEALRARCIGNIDVGCMQINLHYHPMAFQTLEEAFDPPRNVAYAATFLTSLKNDAPSLFAAVGRYHSATEGRGRAYARKVYARWGRQVPTTDAPETERQAAGLRIYRLKADGEGWEVRNGEDRLRTPEPDDRFGVFRSSGFASWRSGRPSGR